MIGREQPYLDKNSVGSYAPTPWVDHVPGIQEGTPMDAEHFGNMETGINGANLMGELIAGVVLKHEKRINNIDGEVITVTLKNSAGAFFNNSAVTLALAEKRDTLNYTVDAEVQGDVVNVGDVVIYDKQLNGFKVKYTGSATSVTLKLYIHGGNAA